MRILSSLPAQLAKIQDLIDRDVTSDLTIHQESLIQLPIVPAALRTWSAAGQTISGSAIVTFNARVANAAQVITQVVVLVKGIWRIRMAVQYFANYVSIGAPTVIVTLNAPPVTPAQFFNELFRLSNSIQTITFNHEVVVALDYPLTAVECTLAANIVAQDHWVNIAFSFEREL